MQTLHWQREGHARYAHAFTGRTIVQFRIERFDVDTYALRERSDSAPSWHWVGFYPDRESAERAAEVRS